jgi:PLP dependent protein
MAGACGESAPKHPDPSGQGPELRIIMQTIDKRLQLVKGRLSQALASIGRSEQELTLLAVSKLQPPQAVREAVAAGQSAFGENYVQEGLQKMAALEDLRPRLQWHLIGPLQSNKTRPVAEAFDWVQSVDRLKIAQRLSEQRPAHLAPLNVCLQVNVSGEASKSGVAPDELPALARAVAALPRLRLRGLMSIPEPVEGLPAQRRPHRELRRLFEALRAQGLALDTLSMGMSADLEAAVAEGSTMVRIGTAIFGERPPQAAASADAPCVWGPKTGAR